jgi:L-ascorbate metabolism protein UlaG (beta-lactamase superfamily)
LLRPWCAVCQLRHKSGAARGHSEVSVKITYIGHATLLLELGPVRILTDPNFDTHLGRILRRVSEPGIALEDLPALDAILLTHAHADHLSFGSLDRLQRDVPLYAPPAIARWLHRKGYDHAQPLEPGEQVAVADRSVRIHAERATHQGNRYGFDRWRRAANMYLCETNDESLFFAGDTALTPDTHALVERVLWQRERGLDVALLPIGYAPSWKPGFRRGHLTHDDALALFEALRARVLIPYHWGTFEHVTASAHDAIDRLRTSLTTHLLRDQVHIIEPGNSIIVTPEQT